MIFDWNKLTRWQESLDCFGTSPPDRRVLCKDTVVKESLYYTGASYVQFLFSPGINILVYSACAKKSERILFQERCMFQQQFLFRWLLEKAMDVIEKRKEYK